MQVWAIIVDSFREARAKKLFWALLGISTLVAAAMACVGFDENGWSFFFGAIKKSDPIFRSGTQAATSIMGALISNVLVATYIGWVGVVICLIGTAGMFPSLVEKGAVDVIVSKPMPRSVLFFGKYLGSLVFVFVQAAYFVLLSLVVIRFLLDRWLWQYLWAIPLLVLSFSYIYCVCVLVAVWTRRTMSSLIYCLMFWVAVSGIAALESTIGTSSDAGQANVIKAWSDRGSIGKASRFLYTISPKPGDIPVILAHRLGALGLKDFTTAIVPGDAGIAGGDDLAKLETEQRRQDAISPTFSIGSSLIFEGVVLLCACCIFARRDF